jgi:hypothetical protein
MDHALALVTGPNAPAAARERAAEFFSDRVAADQAAVLRLLVSELVSEAVERAGQRRRVLQLHLACHGRHIHVELTQAGPASEAPADEAGAELRRSILERSTSDWGIDDRAGGRLWFDLEAPEA